MSVEKRKILRTEGGSIIILLQHAHSGHLAPPQGPHGLVMAWDGPMVPIVTSYQSLRDIHQVEKGESPDSSLGASDFTNKTQTRLFHLTLALKLADTVTREKIQPHLLITYNGSERTYLLGKNKNGSSDHSNRRCFYALL